MASFKFLKALSSKIIICIYICVCVCHLKISCIYNQNKFYKLQKYKFLDCNVNVKVYL